MRRQSKQASAFGDRLEDEMKKAVLEIAQAAMNEPGRSARCAAREIVLLYERHSQTAQRRVARNATSRDSAADDEQIEVVAREREELLTALLDWRIVARGGGCQIVISMVDGCVACPSSAKLISIIGHVTSSSLPDR